MSQIVPSEELEKETLDRDFADLCYETRKKIE